MEERTICRIFKNITSKGKAKHELGIRFLHSSFSNVSQEELKKILEKHIEKCDPCQQNIRKMDAMKKIIVSTRLKIDIKKFEKE